MRSVPAQSQVAATLRSPARGGKERLRAAANPGESRGERRKRETRDRLLAAATRVFVARGFDAATTAEMAEAADLGAGTFYLHFHDKRDAYETIARHVARDAIALWRSRLQPGMGVGDAVALALETATAFWEEDRGRARLILEGGPTFSAEAHLRLVDEIAAVVSTELSRRRARAPLPSPAVIATVMIGLVIEIGRMVVAGNSRATRASILGTIEFARRAFGPSPLSLSRTSR